MSFMSSMPSMPSMSVATWLVKRYPSAWRQRYEEEMLALLEQHHITLLTVFDLLFGLIRARLDPQYRSDSGPILFTSLPAATWKALAAWGVFVLCVAITSGPIELGMIFRLVGHSDIPWSTGSGSLLTSPGQGPDAISMVVGGNLWLAEPLTLLLPLFAITALVCLGCLRWALRTRRWGIIVLTIAWFALPIAIIFWLVTASPFGVNISYIFQYPSLPLGLVTTLGELEALTAIIFLSGLKTIQALRTQRYWLLGLVVGVDLMLILIVVYFVQVWNLFTPITVYGSPPLDYLQQIYFQEALGLVAHLLPFAVVGLTLLALGGQVLGKQGWRAVVLGISLLAVLMAVCDVCYLASIVIGWQLGEGMFAIPVLWARGGVDSWYVVFGIPTGALWITMVLTLLVILRALRSMLTASTAAASVQQAPA